MTAISVSNEATQKKTNPTNVYTHEWCLDDGSALSPFGCLFHTFFKPSRRPVSRIPSSYPSNVPHQSPLKDSAGVWSPDHLPLMRLDGVFFFSCLYSVHTHTQERRPLPNSSSLYFSPVLFPSHTDIILCIGMHQCDIHSYSPEDMMKMMMVFLKVRTKNQNRRIDKAHLCASFLKTGSNQLLIHTHKHSIRAQPQPVVNAFLIPSSASVCVRVCVCVCVRLTSHCTAGA